MLSSSGRRSTGSDRLRFSGHDGPFLTYNCMENRPKVRGKRAVLLVSFEDTDPGSTTPMVDMVRKSMDYLEIELDQVILAPGLQKKRGVAEDPFVIVSVVEAGRSLAH